MKKAIVTLICFIFTFANAFEVFASADIYASVSDFTAENTAENIFASVSSETAENITVSVTAASESVNDANLLCVYYNDGETDSVVSREVLLAANETKTYSFSKNGMEMRFFLWNNNMAPLGVVRQSGTNTVYPVLNNDNIINPYRGYVNYRAEDLQDNSPVKDMFSSIICRPLWSEIEPAEGVYNWTLIDEKIEYAKNNGLRVAIGIQPAYNNKGSMNGSRAQYVIKQAAPLWLFDNYSCPYTTAYYDSPDLGRVTAKVPVWDSDIYLEKMGNFINAFLERYNGNPTVSYVDMRTYGNWGEWHVYGLDGPEDGTDDDSKEISFEAMKKHVDLWKNAELPVVMLGGNNKILEYAKDTLGCGVRLDGLVNIKSPQTHFRIAQYKGDQLTVGEWIEPIYAAGGSTLWSSYMDYLPVLFERTMSEGGYDIISMANHSSTAFYNDYQRITEYWARKMGYRFSISSASYPVTLTQGSINVTVRNDGSGRFPIAGSSGIKLALLGENNNLIDCINLENSDLASFDAGEFLTINTDFAFENTNGADKIAIGFFSDKSLEFPDILLSNDGATEDNWYVLNNMPVVPPENLNDMAVKYSDGERIDKGYGYRHTDYAFDGASDTYWSDSLNEGTSIGTKFYDYIPVNRVKYTVPNNIETTYRLMALTRNGWITLNKGSGLTAGTYVQNTDGIVDIKQLKLVFDSAKSGELLENENFEEGLQNWGNYANSNITPVSERTYNGGGAVLISGRTNQYKGIYYDITDIVKSNDPDSYNFSIMVKASNDGDRYALKIGGFMNDSTRKSFGTYNAICSKDSWTKLYINNCAIDYENCDKIWLYVESGDSNTNDFYVDAASATVFDGVSISENELLKNSSFEDDIFTVDGWSSYANSSIAYETVNVYDGCGAAKVANRTSRYQGLSQEITQALKNGGAGTYKCGIKVKTAAQSAGYVLRVRIVYNDGRSVSASANAVCNNSGWTDITVNGFAVDSTDIYSASLYVESADSNVDEFYVDAATMTRIN